MATTWPTIDIAKPNGTENGVVVWDSARAQFLYSRVAAACTSPFGWNWTQSGSNPRVALASNGAERVRITRTFGTAGGALGNPVAMLVEYSSDSGSTWVTVETRTVSWSDTGDIVSSTRS